MLFSKMNVDEIFKRKLPENPCLVFIMISIKTIFCRSIESVIAKHQIDIFCIYYKTFIEHQLLIVQQRQQDFVNVFS